MSPFYAGVACVKGERKVRGFARTGEDRFQLFGSKEVDEVLAYEKQVTYSGAKTNMHQWWVTTAPWIKEGTK
jgi:hypothetical protein